MKKKYLVYLFIVSFLSSNAQTISFPDANFKARLLAAQPGVQIAYGPGTPLGAMKIDVNNDNEIQISEALMVTSLHLYNASISDITGLENFTNLKEINCYGNSIANMDLSPLTQLTRINISNNHIVTLNVTGLSDVEWLNCHFNDLTNLDLTGMTSMYQLQCQNNQLTSLNLSNASSLLAINCQNNLLTSLSTENINTLYNLNCSSNNLTQLNLKNNYTEINLDFSSNPDLRYICADDIELERIQDKINQYGYVSCYANSNCNYNSAIPVYFIQGVAKYDELNDGCDSAESSYPNLRLVLSDGTVTGNVYSNRDGAFTTASQSTAVTLTPQLENALYFTITPSSLTLELSDTVNPLTQNFCVTPNGSHPDLEILLVRTNHGSSAQNYDYILTYRNKGTNTQSGTISLSFESHLQNFISSNPSVVSSSMGLLTWNYSDLKPFETRTIQITFYMNSEMPNPTVFEGDILNYVATISSGSMDDTPNDNTYTLNEVYSGIVLLNAPQVSFSDYFAMYPNPTNSFLNIKTKTEVSINTLAIFNLLGQEVLRVKNISSDSVIDVTQLITGTYIIKIFSDRGTFNSKFIKI